MNDFKAASDLTEHTLSTEQVWRSKLLDERRGTVRLPDAWIVEAEGLLSEITGGVGS